MARTHSSRYNTARTFAALEAAVDHAHMGSFEKANVSQKLKARVSSALNHCIEAATDLERFLGHAAVGLKDRTMHDALHDAEKTAGDFVLALQDALRSIDAFVDNQGTGVGALRRAAFELDIAFSGRTDQRVLARVETALLRTIGVYDQALQELGMRSGAFHMLVAEQREVLSAIHRDLAHRIDM